MKRSDADSNGRIKDVGITSATALPPMSISASGNTIANVVPRPLLDQLPQIPVTQSNSSANLQRVIAHAGGTPVAVFRDSPGTTISAAPPIAHGGGSATHHIIAPPTVVTAAPPSSKPETTAITLPNTPVSVQYAPFPAMTVNAGPLIHSPATVTPVKTLSPLPVSSASTTPAPQLINPKNFGPSVRAITTAALPSVPLSVAASVTTNSNAGNQNNTQFQRLKVEDALSYLDQVKYKFGKQPQVYNDFLDIMKEFKSQSIDTPGVITRVSCLFRGHPELIVGFNTFLPPGYKIELQRNDNMQVSVGGLLGSGMQTIVHTPNGVHTMSAHGGMSALAPATTTGTPLMAQNVTINQGSVTGTPVSSSGAVAIRPVTIQHPTKFAPVKDRSSEHVIPGVHLFSATTTTPVSTQTLINTASVSLTAVSNPTPTNAVPVIPTPPPPIIPQGIMPNNNNSIGPPDSRSSNHLGTIQTQPVEFNHAINYVNKIKNRFQGQPEVYKQFLEILHSYQKDQKAIKDGTPVSENHLTEAQVYSQVSRLFQNQEDLLSEFGQFLPEATNDSSAANAILLSSKSKDKGPVINNDRPPMNKKSAVLKPPGFGAPPNKFGIKRPPPSISAHPSAKKLKIGVLRDVSLSEAGKYGSLNEFAFFDKVRKALRNQSVYDNFLRCLILFNQEIISRAELVQVTSPFLNKHPDLFKWFKDFLGYNEGNNNINLSSSGGNSLSQNNDNMSQNIGNRETALEIDYATCKRLGASYCALPQNVASQSASKRSSLCREVLNDTWVSFPSWSEDSQFVTSRKTQYEESIYRTEDERFEFDVILETNRDTIKVLECVQRKMSRMAPEEAARYKLDDGLGGSSHTIHQRAIRRIYGDRAQDIIEGLKRNPVVAVPIVLKRLIQKDEEWREVQKNFNKTWRDQNEKNYLKSLDHQGHNFKQSDARNLRSKSFLNEIETLYDERHEQEENSGESLNGPHLTIEYSYPSILEDANNLLIHHVKRQPSIQKEDKRSIKVLLKHFFMDMFKHSRQELSDDERDDCEEEEDVDDLDDDKESTKLTRSRRKKEEKKEKLCLKKERENNVDKDLTGMESKDDKKLNSRDSENKETYTHIMCNNNWYLFIRLHNILCERLTKIYNQAVLIADDENREKKDRKESTAVALRLKPKNEIEAEDYYPAFIDMVKNLLDGNLDSLTFEDTLREMFGIHAYIAYTLDKVVVNAVRQLQHLVTDEACIECQEMFVQESLNNATGGAYSTASKRQMAELLYQKRCEKILSDENCMKIIFYHRSCKVTVELLDSESDSNPVSDQQDEELSRKWHNYVDRFIQPGDSVSDACRDHLSKKPVFLPRGIRSYKRSPFSLKIANNDSNADENTQENKNKDDSKDLKLSNNILYKDNIQCNFNPRTFKVLYVIKSENCFYRQLSLRRAKESHKVVSRRKTKNFNDWHASWVSKNISESQQLGVLDWFMGKTEGLVPNKTLKVIKNNMDITPYRIYAKWKVDKIPS